MSKEITEEQLKNLELLERLNSHSLLVLLGTSIGEQRDNMLVAQGNGKLRNNKFNDGYMTALKDIKISIEYLIKENIDYVKQANGIRSDNEIVEEGSTGDVSVSGQDGRTDSISGDTSINDSGNSGTDTETQK